MRLFLWDLSSPSPSCLITKYLNKWLFLVRMQNTLLKRTLKATLKAFLPPDMISAVLESGTVKHLQLILLIFQLQNKTFSTDSINIPATKINIYLNNI